MSTNNLNKSQNFLTVSDSSFWEIGGYKANVQRIREGSRQLSELAKLIKERVDLESKYGKSLQAWNQKWSSYADCQLPIGCIKTCLNGILSESKVLARVHLAVKDRFNDEVIETIGKFKKENYHRSTIRGLKEPREIEEEFEKAQQRWKKLYERIEAAKKHYHVCRRSEKSAYIQMINSHADSSVLQDGTDKSREKYDKSKEQADKSRLAYEVELEEISKYNSVYVENMAFVFEKCQQIELKRLKFFVEMLSGMQKILVDLVSPPKLFQIHSNLEQTFSTLGDVDYANDLNQWSLFHGKDLAPKWPVFEEYTPEFHNISTKSNSHESTASVILTKKILKAGNDCDGRLYNIGNLSPKDKNVKISRTVSISTLDVCKLSTTTNASNNTVFKNVHTKHRRVYSFESILDNTTNFDTLSANFNENSSSQLNGFVTAKSTPAHKQKDPFSDPFPMPTPERYVHHLVDHNSLKPSILNRDSTLHYGAIDNKNLEDNIKAYGTSWDRLAGSGLTNYNIKLCEDTKTTSNLHNDNVATLKSSLSVESADAIKENVLPCGDTTNKFSAMCDNEAQLKHSESYKTENVKALYNYDAVEDDELSLVKGEIIEVLRPVDNLGWCYGRKNNKIGFFPAGYVSKV